MSETMTRWIRRLAPMIGIGLLSGCTVGPRYSAPAANLPAAWASAPVDAAEPKDDA